MNGKFLIQWFIFHKQGCQEAAAELEDQEPDNGNDDRCLCCRFDGLFYAVILLRAEVEPMDGRCAGSQPHEHRMGYLIQFHHQTIAGNGYFAAINGHCAVFAHQVIHDDLGRRRCRLGTEAGETQFEDIANDCAPQSQIFFFQMEVLISGQVRQCDDTGNDLSDNSR